MNAQEIKTTPGFKSQLVKTVISILLFVLVYLVILILAIGLTIGCIYLGYNLITFHVSILTIIIGAGIGIIGVVVLFFLIKFAFKVTKVDRSHLVEIKRNEEPELFKMIDEIVKKVNTSFPKKVFLSADVNAAVFYDSSFWSMFLPIRKNLMIGLGLVNAITKEELKAILSHEFGHFSQDSMRLGSYVYNVNQIIHNLLFDNESLQKVINSLSSLGSLSFFIGLSVGIIEGIQWILRMMYGIVNKSYMGLSREMEFQADQIASTVTGSEPLISSLLRLDLAQASFGSAIEFYESRIAENKKSENIFKEQFYVMSYLAEKNQLSFNDNKLPIVTFNELNKFNKSKLVIENQWASHPTLEQRVDHLNSFSNSVKDSNNELANYVFKDLESIQHKLTKKIFQNVAYIGKAEFVTYEGFKSLYHEDFEKNSFDILYNGYYDNYNIQPFDLDKEIVIKEELDFKKVFSEKAKEEVISLLHLRNDEDTIKRISSKEIQVRTFDYDGVKYKRKKCAELIKTLQDEIGKKEVFLKELDEQIYSCLLRKETDRNKDLKLKDLYGKLFSFDNQFESKVKLFSQLIDATQFFQHQISATDVFRYLGELSLLENQLKEEIKFFLEEESISMHLSVQIRENFALYLSKEWRYFINEAYQDKNIEMLYAAINNYYWMLNKTYFQLKKDLLDYQVELVNE